MSFVINVQLLLSFRTFKASSIEFKNIESLLKYKTLNVKLETNYEKLSIIKRLLNHYGENEVSLGNIADVFETENSIYIFPYRKDALKKESINKKWPNLLTVEYLEPIKFSTNSSNRITSNNPHNFIKFFITNNEKDTIIEFKDKKLKTKIKVKLLDYKHKIVLVNNDV